jgi:hypothetical protein
VANYPSVLARVEEVQAKNEAECRWGRKQLLDFYCEVLERGAGTLTPDDRLCQACEDTTVTHYNGKGEAVRTVHKRRLIMPAKVEAADGIRKMLGWDKRPDDQPQDDITELLVMIRRRSGGTNVLEAPKTADANSLPEKTESTQGLEALSSEPLEPSLRKRLRGRHMTS